MGQLVNSAQSAASWEHAQVPEIPSERAERELRAIVGAAEPDAWLATVFRTDAEPFVAPSGGCLDEIIRAVRDCPSGALSYAIDGTEAREQVDRAGTREPAIEVSKDGPYRITGQIDLVGPAGSREGRSQGASLEHYALCRCGHSQNKPFCSGMHWYRVRPELAASNRVVAPGVRTRDG